MLALFQVKFDNAQEQIYSAISSYIHLDSLAQVFVINKRTLSKSLFKQELFLSLAITHTQREDL